MGRYALVLAGSILLIALLYWINPFAADVDDSRRAAAIGCYYLDEDLVLRATATELRLTGGDRVGYAIDTDRIGISILPDSRLRLNRVAGSGRQLVIAPGLPDKLRLQGPQSSELAIFAPGSQLMIADRRPCR